jgi:GMP synthase-like glutamine amidotransferase
MATQKRPASKKKAKAPAGRSATGRSAAGQKVLLIQHVQWEGPGIIGEVLRTEGADVKRVKTYKAQPIPVDEVADGEFDCVIALGSPSTAYLPETNIHHEVESELMRKIRKAGVPSFNVCYSMQLFSVVHGGTVAPNPKGKEIGFVQITMNDAGRRDPVVGGSGWTRMLQWHGDCVTKLPHGAVLLGSSAKTDNQLAVVDGIHYLVQGDGQASRPEMIRRWFDCDAAWVKGTRVSWKNIVSQARIGQKRYIYSYSKIVKNFLELARNRAP